MLGASINKPIYSVFHWKLERDRKSTRLNSSHLVISYAVFCLKKKKNSDIKVRSTVGLQLVHEMREQRPQLPPLSLTGYAEVDRAFHTLHFLANGFVNKPSRHG